MNTKIKSLILLTASTLVLSSCIEETFPESSTATSEQIGASAAALTAALSGIPSQQCQGYLVYGSQTHETDMGYPQLMIGQTEMLGDMYPEGSSSGYDWYRTYNTSPASGNWNENSYFAYLPWYTLYMFVKSANDVISSANVDIADPSTATESARNAAAIAYAYRAFNYFYLMTFWEPVDNEYTDVSKVMKLTTPIVTESTTNEQAKSNPRASHEDMVKFIISDCENAITLFDYDDFTPELIYPSKAVAYAIMARTYMWDQSYAMAELYARKAIDEFGGDPVTQAQWLDTNTGFNTANQAWMWKGHYDAENMGNLCNFTGWMSGEADWGYSSLTCPSIDRSLYDKISYNDFRKYTFLDPDRSVYDYQSPRGQEWLDEMNDYLSLKFRCVGGNYTDYATGGACDIPIMRVEEMYLLEAEAAGMQEENFKRGKDLLEKFMNDYRTIDKSDDLKYTCPATTQREFQIEVLNQERIEFWGEGEAFPNAKRIKPDVVQNYEGTNAPSNIFKFNCKGIKPNWNFCITYIEMQNNKALEGLNNPDPTACINYPTPIGEWATKK